MGQSNLRARLDRMSRALRPLFVTVTWGAGGSTASKSLELAELTQRELGLTTCLHLTCTNMSRKLVDRALEDAKALGVRNILALRGDPPREEEYGRYGEDLDEVNGRGDGAEMEDVKFEWAVDLVRYIRKQYGDYFCIGVAAYPEGHADEGDPSGQNLEHDLPYLVEKVQAGADFIMTQLFFDVNAYDAFEVKVRNHESGVLKSIPIIPGMMPIQSYSMIKRTTKLSHAKLPPDIVARLDPVKVDDELVKKVGVDILSEMVAHIKSKPSPTPRGFHFYTLNLEKAVSFILERTDLIPIIGADSQSAIIDTDTATTIPVINVIPNGMKGKRAGRRTSSVGSDPHNRVIISAAKTSNPDYEATNSEAGQHREPVNTRANTLAISEGEGALGREATWDDFPNGRWGDARSPAYGEIDGYGVSLHMSINQAIKLWGHPITKEDITKIFIRHIEGDIKAIPWSEEGLNEETHAIKSRLLSLINKGWWTVASQPAINGARSSDAIYGWGPKNGFVFQKAFVEFFLPASDWTTLRQKLESEEIREHVSWYASSSTGEFLSAGPNSPLSSSSLFSSGRPSNGSSTTNAVTWGAFPGKEIITPTIIEEVSFKAWAEEAFGIWAEWGRVYEKGSESKRLIEAVRGDVWLVNVIHHSYVEKEGLWELLGQE